MEMKRFFFIVAVVFLLDRITKTIFQKVSLDLGFLRLHLVKNTGGFWGFFHGFNIMFILITFIILFGIFFFIRRILASPPLFSFAFALVVAGGFSNLIDRIFLGYVIDFIDFGFWPAFNIADSAISVAIILILYQELKPSFLRFKRRKTTKRAKGLNTTQYSQ